MEEFLFPPAWVLRWLSNDSRKVPPEWKAAPCGEGGGGVFDVEGLEAVEVDGCAANRGMVRMPLDLLAGLGILSFTASLGARIFFLANAAALALSMLWTLGKCWPIFCTGPEAQSTTGHQK